MRLIPLRSLFPKTDDPNSWGETLLTPWADRLLVSSPDSFATPRSRTHLTATVETGSLPCLGDAGLESNKEPRIRTADASQLTEAIFDTLSSDLPVSSYVLDGSRMILEFQFRAPPLATFACFAFLGRNSVSSHGDTGQHFLNLIPVIPSGSYGRCSTECQPSNPSLTACIQIPGPASPTPRLSITSSLPTSSSCRVPVHIPDTAEVRSFPGPFRISRQGSPSTPGHQPVGIVITPSFGLDKILAVVEMRLTCTCDAKISSPRPPQFREHWQFEHKVGKRKIQTTSAACQDHTMSTSWMCTNKLKR